MAEAVAHYLTHGVDGSPEHERVLSVIGRATAAWGQLGSRWHDLTRPSDRLDPALAAAAAEVRAAYRELTHDVTTQARLKVIATRPGLARGFAASLDALEVASELANVVAEQADRNDLTGPARALSHRATNDIEAGLATVGPDDDQAWVSPADIFAKRLVALPAPVAEGLTRGSAQVVQDAASAASAVRGTYQGQTVDFAEVASPAWRRSPEAPRLTAPTVFLGLGY